MSLTRSLRALVACTAMLALVATLVVSVGVTEASAQDEPRFSDLDGTLHARAIELIADEGITTGYPDGTFRPREDVRRDQMATFLTTALDLTPRPATFPDVPENNVHHDAIGALAASEITTGYPDGTYRPRNVVTRGQMATFLAVGLELDAGSETFDDVPADYVHADNIAALASAGITTGYPDGTFRPNQPVKRDQMAAFLAVGLGLPREEECPSPASTSDASTASTDADAEEPPAEGEGEDANVAGDDPGLSEDLLELRSAERTDEGGDVSAQAAADVADRSDLGDAVPGVAFPLTSALRTSAGAIEVHSQDLSDSRGAHVEDDGEVSATTRIPAGTRTWAATEHDGNVYVGQWGTGNAANLYRYPVQPPAPDDEGESRRTATSVATVPVGGEFWDLASDAQGRLWAASRAHRDADVQRASGLRSNGIDDPRHVVQRIDQLGGSPRVTSVLFGVRCLPTTASGQRPDIKQVATHGATLYAGLGQQAAGARLYAMEPGDRREVPTEDVRDLTPESVLSATSIFSLEVTDDYIAFGTEGSASTSARLVVLDRRTEQVRVDVTLRNERRVDAVAVDGRRVVASALTGRTYETTVPTGSGVATSATRRDAPVDGQFSRYVEFVGDAVRGITNQGIVWTRTGAGDPELVNLVDTGAPVDAGLPHSLHVGAADVAVGSTSAVTLRDRSQDEPDPRTISLQGEAKAMTSSPAGDTFIASYPNAQLWRIEAGGDTAETVQGWNGAFTRPAAAVFDDRGDSSVHVIAREEGNQISEPCNAACGTTRTGVARNRFYYRPSRLFSVAVADPGSGQVPGRPLTTGDGTPVEASALAVGDRASGTEVYVGDTRGGVQRVNASNGAQQWYATPTGDRRWREVIDVELVGERLVVTTTGALYFDGGSENRTRTIIDERDPVTGQLLATYTVSDVFIAGDAVHSGDVSVLTRRNQLVLFDRSDQSTTTVGHAPNQSFGGPYVGLGTDCDLYNLEGTVDDDGSAVPGRRLVRRTLEAGGCAPGVDPPVDLP